MTAWNPDDTPNFSHEELACKCGCGRADMDAGHMARLQEYRDLVGLVKVTSGFRCSEHPAERTKQRPGSHAQGLATDVRPLRTGTYIAILRAYDVGFVGIGKADSFIHLDSGHAHMPRPAFWTY